ncbi:MAG: hypothetical protein U0136_04815 [Bdellovibrionota bacterium]
MAQAAQEPKTDTTQKPAQQPAAGPQPLLPAAVSAKAAAARLQAFGDAILPEVERIANDPKLKPLVPMYFGMSADGSYFVLPNQNPAAVLEAIKRVRELPPDMIPRINERLANAKLDPQSTIALPPPVIKPSDDPHLSTNNPATVAQALRTYNGMLERAPDDVQKLLRPALASHLHQAVDLLDRTTNQPSDEVRTLAVTFIGRIGSPHADGAYGKIKTLSESAKPGTPLKAACDEALKSLKPPAAETEPTKAVAEPAKPSTTETKPK